MVYLAEMVIGFIFYDVVRCWCLFPGTTLWDWVLNSGLVEKLPSASCQVFSSLIDFFAAMFLVLLDVAMMWLASGWHVALARSVLLLMFVGLLPEFKVSKPGSEAAFSACLLHAATGGLTHCGLCPFLVGATLMWLAPAGSLRFVFFGFFVAPIAFVFMDGFDAAFSARLLDAASGGLALGGSCPLMVGATLLWLAPAGFESLLLQKFYASGLWMCALLVAVPKTESVPVRSLRLVGMCVLFWWLRQRMSQCPWCWSHQLGMLPLLVAFSQKGKRKGACRSSPVRLVSLSGFRAGCG